MAYPNRDRDEKGDYVAPTQKELGKLWQNVIICCVWTFFLPQSLSLSFGVLDRYSSLYAYGTSFRPLNFSIGTRSHPRVAYINNGRALWNNFWSENRFLLVVRAAAAAAGFILLDAFLADHYNQSCVPRMASHSVGKRRKEEAWESTINNHHRMYAGLCKYGFLGILLSVSFEGRMLKNFSN